jgi:hypothetical protein
MRDETEEMQRQSDRLRHQIEEVRTDWERKRGSDQVPGAPPRESADEDDSSPAPEAPPADAGPADGETPSETAAGPPAD